MIIAFGDKSRKYTPWSIDCTPICAKFVKPPSKSSNILPMLHPSVLFLAKFMMAYQKWAGYIHNISIFTTSPALKALGLFV